MARYPQPRHVATRPHMRATRAWLRALRAEAEAGAEAHGPLRGPIRAAQRPWSRVLDVLAALDDEAREGVPL